MKRSGAHLLHKKLFSEKIIVPVFFILFFLTVIFIYKDYGLSWDEPYCRERGKLNFQYISYLFGQNEEDTAKTAFLEKWNSYPYQHHGPSFDLIFFSLEKLFLPETPRQVHLMRHLLTFLIFFIACIIFYLSNRHRFNWKISLLATAFLVLSPRIFAHAFYNAKDIIFMAMVIFTFYTMIRVLKNPKFTSILLHSIITALAIDTRITGLFIPLLTVIFLIFFINKDLKKQLLIIKPLIYLFLLCLFIYVFWPWLWHDPFQRFSNSISDISNYEWKDLMLYRGKWIYSTNLPWHYLFTWIGITTPVIYLVLFIIGLIVSVKNLIMRITKLPLEQVNQFNLMALGFLFAPVFAIFILQSTLYDGWRHMFFIYPCIIMIAATGLYHIVNLINSKSSKIRGLLYTITGIILAANFVLIISFMIRNHPHQYLYFNALTGDYPEQKYELDYWGLSYRQAYEELLNKFPNDTLLVCPANNAGKSSLILLKSSEKKRLKLTEFNAAEYFVTNFRWLDRKVVKKKLKPYQHEILEIKVDGMKVAAIYKLK